ncbi:MAG: folate/biopterin family MFS transporter [Cyanobacteria bacterium]|nr:folate/biopterin family MFS transporter [Cyanobacteria bacterium CG_2015-16_32_12]NCO78327.1 folate/biopterin family MFS transporter [Cyanobacteria bacterium CG_2015-22_32_23]NCQ04801.1 folate/biopterin family MFS transporter [Cyanobacteria bacterium CG_2015-09_32_10]NCQ42349.1 folate/biopterin family MFS transporter [Cyanobacteria bacterium CG_2015-04_32_10]NCS83786.1 folate/biopterin family MFS transporter [Cyanobacteria bacterium CG_2015-02_32_10]
MFINIYQQTKIKEYIEEKLLFGNKLTPEFTAILIVYFVQGILGLARLAVSFFLKDELMLSPAQVSALMGIAAIPWVTKPIIGFLSDGKPLFGYRRRSYLFLSGILGALAWLALGTIVNNAWSATIAILFTSLSVAISDVIVDSVVVERAKTESLAKSGSLQSVTWGASALGGLITAYFSGALLQHFSNNQVFLITATFPLLVTAIAGLIIEKPTEKQPLSNPFKGQIKQLWQTITQKSILAPVIFIALWQGTPSADSAFFFFSTNELGFTPEFLGRIRLITSLAALIGIFCYQKWLKQIPFRMMLGWCVVLSSLLGMTSLILVTHFNRSLGIDDHWFSLGDSLILTVMGQIAFMPVLVLSARLCPEGIEASFFALLMSIWNLAGLLSHELGALLTHWLGVTQTNFDNLWLLLLITNLSSLLPLFLLKLLPNEDPQIHHNLQNLPTSEIYEHHSSGAVFGQDIMPDVIIDISSHSVKNNQKSLN